MVIGLILIALHIVSSDYVKSKLNLLHTLVHTEYPFMTIVNDEINCLIKSFQSSLKNDRLIKTNWINRLNQQ